MGANSHSVIHFEYFNLSGSVFRFARRLMYDDLPTPAVIHVTCLKTTHCP